MQDLLPYTVHQRHDGLWTVLDATGREVDGIAHECRANAENFIRVITAMQAGPIGTPYVHVTYRDGTEETL